MEFIYFSSAKYLRRRNPIWPISPRKEVHEEARAGLGETGGLGLHRRWLASPWRGRVLTCTNVFHAVDRKWSSLPQLLCLKLEN